jgi:hypothetical protein
MRCDCHLYERQVCDVCQGVTGREVDKAGSSPRGSRRPKKVRRPAPQRVSHSPSSLETQQRKEHIWCEACGSVASLVRDYMPADGLHNMHAATDLLCGECHTIIATLHHLDDREALEATPRARTQTREEGNE